MVGAMTLVLRSQRFLLSLDGLFHWNVDEVIVNEVAIGPFTVDWNGEYDESFHFSASLLSHSRACSSQSGIVTE